MMYSTSEEIEKLQDIAKTSGWELGPSLDGHIRVKSFSKDPEEFARIMVVDSLLMGLATASPLQALTFYGRALQFAGKIEDYEIYGQTVSAKNCLKHKLECYLCSLEPKKK